MTIPLEIRDTLPDDLASIEALYPAAFPDEDLLPLVRALSRHPSALSLGGFIGASLAGHVMFTAGGIGGSEGAVALLAPLAVAPAWQRQGIGSALVRAGMERQRASGVTQVFVLGDPEYYGRFGFTQETRVAPPYTLPEEWRGAWQSIRLDGSALPRDNTLALPQPWLDPALWAP